MRIGNGLMTGMRAAAAVAVAVQLCAAAGYEFEGVGARQVSRAGAAIADADDWSAIYWNPAAMGRAGRPALEFGVELFGGEAFASDSNSLSTLPAASANFQRTDIHSGFLLGAMGLVFPVGDRAALGAGFYTPLLQGASFTDVSADPVPVRIDLDNSAAILTWALAGSYRVTDRLFAGAGLNLLYGRLTSDVTVDNFLVPGNSSANEVDGDGLGLEGVVSLHYDPRPWLSLGAVYRTGSDLTLEGDATVDSTSSFIPNERSDFEYELRHPASWGVGAAFRTPEAWVFTLDFNQTLWNRFVGNIVYDTPGSLIVNQPNTFNWRDSWKIRFGAKRRLSATTDLFAGLSRERPALDDGSIDLSTSIDVPMTRFSAGVAHRWRPFLETTLGVIAGYGKRSDPSATYRLTGYQVMAEVRLLRG